MYFKLFDLIFTRINVFLIDTQWPTLLEIELVLPCAVYGSERSDSKIVGLNFLRNHENWNKSWVNLSFSGTFLSQERGHSSKLPFIIKRVWRVFCKECFINTPTSYLWKSVTQLHLKLWRSSVFILTYGRLQKRKKEKKKDYFLPRNQSLHVCFSHNISSYVYLRCNAVF